MFDFLRVQAGRTLRFVAGNNRGNLLRLRAKSRYKHKRNGSKLLFHGYKVGAVQHQLPAGAVKALPASVFFLTQTGAK